MGEDGRRLGLLPERRAPYRMALGRRRLVLLKSGDGADGDRIPDFRRKNLLSAGGWKNVDTAEDVYAG